MEWTLVNDQYLGSGKNLGGGLEKLNTVLWLETKLKDLQQAQKWIDKKELFHKVIFTDETTVGLDRFATM